jgi:hypothetical protein
MKPQQGSRSVRLAVANSRAAKKCRSLQRAASMYKFYYRVAGTVESGVRVTPSGVVCIFGALSDVAPELLLPIEESFVEPADL